MFNEWPATDKVMLTQVMPEALADVNLHLSVPIPSTLHLELARVALQHHLSREALAQSWLVQHLEEQRTAA